jgi:hypothetical protein
MNRHSKTSWLATFSVLLLVSAMSVACGGGGGDPSPPINGGLAATWTPAEPNPGAMTISLGSGGTSGANFTVPVQVTGIDDFFGAAFRVRFNSATVDFVSFSSAGTVIDAGGATLLITAVEQVPGEVWVNATRQQGAGGAYVPGVDVGTTSMLITLNFRATGVVAANTFTFINREVQTCNDAAQTCAPVPDGNLTWSGGTLRAS